VHRLKNAYRGERAAVIMGGPSLLDQRFALERLRSRNVVVFLESQALTPRFLESGLVPDYFLMLFPQKCSGNGFHNFVFRSFLAGRKLDALVRSDFVPIVRNLRERFDEYFMAWRPHRGPHKKYRWRQDVELENSPAALLRQLPATKILANRPLLAEAFPSFSHPNERFEFEHGEPQRDLPFSTGRYYAVEEREGRVFVPDFGFLSSAAISLYPLLKYMGFRTVYMLGMDMSMLGTMEYAAPYTFKSMLHYRWFFQRSQHVFNAAYKPNRPWYFRPKSEFDDLKALLDPEQIDLVRVMTPYKYMAPTPFMHSMTEPEFWREAQG
jgi:hypothetical protein